MGHRRRANRGPSRSVALRVCRCVGPHRGAGAELLAEQCALTKPGLPSLPLILGGRFVVPVLAAANLADVRPSVPLADGVDGWWSTSRPVGLADDSATVAGELVEVPGAGQHLSECIALPPGCSKGPLVGPRPLLVLSGRARWIGPAGHLAAAEEVEDVLSGAPGHQLPIQEGAPPEKPLKFGHCRQVWAIRSRHLVARFSGCEHEGQVGGDWAVVLNDASGSPTSLLE